MTPVVTRFAPSPTGFIHVGNVRTALYAWLFARKHGGRFILRIEDTDKRREVEGSIPHIIESLTWLGIEWDEGVDKGGPHGPYKQSERLELYHSYARRLIATGHAYADPYTEDELEALRQKALDEKRPFLFRDHRLTAPTSWDGTKPLRYRIPDIARTTWNDAVRGELTAGSEALDDFILIKSDGYPTYNFAHIVDDIEMGVTHVMRGQEFISSTPNYLSLYKTLGITPPVFATMPPIMGEGGYKKLGKRDGAKDILEYRAEGYLPDAMLNFLALLGWNPGTDQEYLSKEELIAAFDLARVQPSGAQFDETKLLSVNQHWMRALTDNEYLEHMKSLGDFPYDEARVKQLIPLLKERAHTSREAHEMLSQELGFFFTTPSVDPVLLVAKEPVNHSGFTRTALEYLIKLISGLREGVSIDDVKAAIMPFADADEQKGKGGRGAVLWPLRYALSGKERSPDPFTLIAILGTDEAIARIHTALAILSE